MDTYIYVNNVLKHMFVPKEAIIDSFQVLTDVIITGLWPRAGIGTTLSL